MKPNRSGFIRRALNNYLNVALEFDLISVNMSKFTIPTSAFTANIFPIPRFSVNQSTSQTHILGFIGYPLPSRRPFRRGFLRLSLHNFTMTAVIRPRFLSGQNIYLPTINQRFHMRLIITDIASQRI